MCLDHVPPHLQTHDRPKLDRFWVEELLYWRIPESKQSEIPFTSITLADVSMNRTGEPGQLPISKRDDVLINTELTEKNPHPYFQMNVAELMIRSLHIDTNGRVRDSFEDSFQDETGQTTRLEFLAQLQHDPLPCNYAHTMMVFYVNRNQVKFGEYKQDGSLGFEGKPKGKERALSRARQRFRVYLQGFLIAR